MHYSAAHAAHKSARPAASATPQNENSAKTFPETRSREYLPKERTSRPLQTSQNDFSTLPLYPKRPLRLSENETPPAGSDRDENRPRASKAASPEPPPARFRCTMMSSCGIPNTFDTCNRPDSGVWLGDQNSSFPS